MTLTGERNGAGGAARADGAPAPAFDKQPPQDLTAEQSVLGGMMLSKDAIADVVERLTSQDFYRPAHQALYDCVLDLYGHGEPADPVTVASELERRGELGRIGGAPYLHTLIETVPTAANAGYYAQIVADKAVLRRLVEAGTRIAQLGYAGGDGDEVDEVVDRAQAAVYDATSRRMTEDYVVLEELLQPTMDEIDAIASRGSAQGVPTGFLDLDALTNGLHAAQMVILAARPGVGKSTLGLDIARSCSIRNGMTSVIFSLEMSRSEIVMRMLSAEARIRLGDMRGGRMSDEDWTRLARRISEIADAPLYIDDSPNMTMMEIRAKARRLRQRHDLRLVVVDYMQLMTSGKRVESRQQEVSEFSRQLKLLAKELDIPVVAISQLNRGPEQRTDKRPMLADLRESGCVTAATRILRADTGAETSIGELLCRGERPLVWSLDESLRLVPRPMTDVFPTGTKEVFRLRLASGRELEATANHPMLTVDGWVPLGQLAPGDRVATPRAVPEPLGPQPLPDAEVILLAHLLGAGSFAAGQPIRYSALDEANLAAVRAAAQHFGRTPVRDDDPGARTSGTRAGTYRLGHGARNPIATWLEGLGILGLPSQEKVLPERVFALPNEQVAVFLRHLWAAAGSLARRGGSSPARVHYASPSRALVDGLAQLLLRFGILSRIGTAEARAHRPRWALDVTGAEDQRRFLEQVGVHGAGRAAAGGLATAPRGIVGNSARDTIPPQLWRRAREALAARGTPQRRLARLRAVPGASELEMPATNQVAFDEIAEVEPLGEQEVYDATVAGTHNYVANGLSIHNSLEQDADIVLLISRPDAWERDDPRAGEADLILAKHRSGPTNTITVAHQLHYSRFVDLAQG